MKNHLKDDTKQKIRSFYAELSENLPGFKARLGQRQMIACVSHTLSQSLEKDDQRTGSNICVIEGKTGVGKTMGYMVPAITMAIQQGKTLVISSATVALQEQLIERDLPAVLQFFPDKSKVHHVIAKGRNRYACISNLKNMTTGSTDNMSFSDATWDRPPRRDELETLTKLEKMLGKSWSGDRDELSFTVPDDLWARIKNDTHGCPGRTCTNYEACPFMLSRSKIHTANIIVCNHDYLLSALFSESKSFPPIEDCIIVLDEAHHVPEIAIRRFGVNNGVKDALSWMGKMSQQADKIQTITKGTVNSEKIKNRLIILNEEMSNLHTAILHSNYFEKNPIHRYEHGRLDKDMQEFADRIKRASDACIFESSGITEQLNEFNKSNKNETVTGSSSENSVLAKIQSDFGFFISKLTNLQSTWFLFSQLTDATPLAKWIELEKEDFVVCASPLSASEVLSKMIWSKASAVVLTSATITTLGNFNYFLEHSGLNRYPNTTTLGVPSPFNFQEQGKIYIPALTSDPKNAQEHTQEIIDLLPQILDRYLGSLVLFASKKQMTEVYDALAVKGGANSVLLQGQRPKREILKIHSDKIKAGQVSAIFGLAGFGEGVDLPGELCSQLIVTKIPFAPPTSPIETATNEWVESKGGNAFFEVSLPKAGLKLTQWVGRLIRSESDNGRVVFLDARMLTARYRTQLLASLPNFPIVRA